MNMTRELIASATQVWTQKARAFTVPYTRSRTQVPPKFVCVQAMRVCQNYRSP